MPHNHSKRSYILLYGAIFLLALNGLFAKYIPLNAVSQTVLRSFFAAAFITITLLLVKRVLLLPSRRDVLGVYVLGVLMGIHWVTFFHAMQISTVAVGMLALFSFPMLTVLIEPLFSRVRLHRGDIIAAVILFLGLLIMAGSKLLEPQSNLLQGIAWGVFSAVLFVLRNLSQKYHFAHISSDRLMLHQLIAIFIMLLPFLDVEASLSMDYKSWIAMLVLGVLTTAVAHTIVVASYKKLPAKTVAMLSCLQPPIGAVLAWWLLGEVLSLNIIIGGGLILSVALYESVQQAQRASKKLTEAKCRS